MLTSQQILKLVESQRAVLARYGIKRLGLFGSYLHGTPRAGSDLDFLVSFTKPSFDNYMELKFYLEDLFKKKVDLVMEKSLKPALRHIKKEVLYAKRL